MSPKKHYIRQTKLIKPSLDSPKLSSYSEKMLREYKEKKKMFEDNPNQAVQESDIVYDAFSELRLLSDVLTQGYEETYNSTENEKEREFLKNFENKDSKFIQSAIINFKVQL
jgi:hypothetical protein